MGLGHVCSLDTTAPNLTFHSVRFESPGREVTQVQPRNRVYYLRHSPTKYSHVLPAGISTWAGTRWHGLPNMEVLSWKLGNTCNPIPLTFFLIRTGINGKGFDSSTLLVTKINHESASPDTSLSHTIFLHAQLLAYSSKRAICTPAEKGKEV